MSYRDPTRQKWLTRGSAAGCLSAIAIAILGFPVLFATIWGCVPAHRIADADPCQGWEAKVVLLIILVVGGVGFWLVRRFVDKRDGQAKDE